MLHIVYMGEFMDFFTKRRKLVHNGGFLTSEVLYFSQNTMENLPRFKKTIVARYSLPNKKISGELKNCNSFWMYPPLWISFLLAMHDDIENTSVARKSVVKL